MVITRDQFSCLLRVLPETSNVHLPGSPKSACKRVCSPPTFEKRSMEARSTTGAFGKGPRRNIDITVAAGGA